MNQTLDNQSIEVWTELPIQLMLSFEKIIEYWEKQAAEGSPGNALLAKEVLSCLEDYPELRKPISDLSVVEKCQKGIEKLLSVVFAAPLQDNEIKTGTIPFTNFSFNPTRRFVNLMAKAGPDYKMEIKGGAEDQYYFYACAFILMKNYGVDFKSFRSYFLDIPNLDNGWVYHYRAMFNGDFSTIEPVDPNFKLDDSAIALLQNNAHNIEIWKEIFPPNSFVFKGFGIMSLFDVTAEVVISELKTDMLVPEALYSKSHLDSMVFKMQRILAMPDLEFGFLFLNKADKLLECVGNVFLNSLLIEEETVSLDEAICQHGEELLLSESIVVFPDLTEIEEVDHPQVTRLMSKGIKSYAAIPLYIDKNTTAILELGSPNLGEINTVSINRINDVIPIFIVALQRWVIDHETLMEAIIQENFTAIHPTVSWRFLEVADQIWKAKQQGKEGIVKDIVFDQVIPLYGQSDIKGSSSERNRAVESDLITQLTLAGDILTEALTEEPLVLYQQLVHRINRAIGDLEAGMNAGDEVSLGEFLKQEVYPAFDHIRNLSPKMNTLVDGYINRLDPEMGNIYEERKKFEVSVAMINDQLGNYLEKQQEIAQKIYPHYFEKYKTDGVEHNIYIGAALVKNQPYHDIYLQNLQLWQLQTICGMERLVHQLHQKMPMKLEVASLILVHGSPITVKFKVSSKVFDVDGAYNIRYEIIKKRIDKSHIKGTKERLTQVGKIAIVYTQDRDAVTYRRYLDYLASIGEVEKEIEELELEDLQGVHGLRALRVKVV